MTKNVHTTGGIGGHSFRACTRDNFQISEVRTIGRKFPDECRPVSRYRGRSRQFHAIWKSLGICVADDPNTAPTIYSNASHRIGVITGIRYISWLISRRIASRYCVDQIGGATGRHHNGKDDAQRYQTRSGHSVVLSKTVLGRKQLQRGKDIRRSDHRSIGIGDEHPLEGPVEMGQRYPSEAHRARSLLKKPVRCWKGSESAARSGAEVEISRFAA